MNTREEMLVAKVDAVNRAHEYAGKLYDTLSALFIPLVGEKILRADGSLLAKYKAVLPVFPNTVPLSVSRHSGDLAWDIKTCQFMPPNSTWFTCVYHHTTIYIGDVIDGKLIRICPKLTLPSNYTVDEVVNKREVLRLAKEMVEQAKASLWPFDEYDR